MIVVSIAYRHNFFGFLTSKELLEDQKANGETPILNQGLNDQRLALQWIQRYIHLFGGNPDRVTLSGESAGAHSVWCQIKGRTTNLFSRAIIRSFPPARSSNFEDAQKRFDSIIEKLGVHPEAPGVQKVAALRSLSAQELVGFWDGSAFPPVLDDVWMALPEADVEFGSLEYWTDAPSWVKEVISGCTKDEAILFCGEQWQNWTWDQAKASLESVLPSHILDTVLKSPVYKDKKTPLEAMNAVVSDASFIGASVIGAEMQAARNKGKLRVYFYIMEAPDQHPGPLQGWAAHAADVSTVFYQPAQQDYPEQAAVADQHSEYMISFIYGSGPGDKWQQVGESSMYMAFRGRDTRMKDLHEDRLDREILFEDPKDREIFYGSGFGIIASSLRALNG